MIDTGYNINVRFVDTVLTGTKTLGLVNNSSQTTTISITGNNVGDLTNNMFDSNSFADVPVIRGNLTITDKGFILTSTSGDCYTRYESQYTTNIPIEPDTDYILTWKAPDVAGNVYVFGNGDRNYRLSANNKDTKQLHFRFDENVTFITLRFGVSSANTSIHYSDISVRKASEKYEPYGKYKIPIINTNDEYSANVYIDTPLTGQTIDSTIKLPVGDSTITIDTTVTPTETKLSYIKREMRFKKL